MVDKVENWKCIRWIKRCWPEKYDNIRQAVCRLNNVMADNNFCYAETMFDGDSIQLNSINFEKNCLGDCRGYVDTIFHKRYPLLFQINFAVKKLEFPHDWVRAGCLSRDGRIDMSSRWFGPKFFHIFKLRKFEKDWRLLMDSIPAIDRFLEDGSESGYILRQSIGSANY